jgi:hypothetical protein
MDDFYPDIGDTLDILSDQEKKVSPEFSISPQDPGILASYFPNIFCHIGMPDLVDKLKNPLDNLLVASEYLETQM